MAGREDQNIPGLYSQVTRGPPGDSATGILSPASNAGRIRALSSDPRPGFSSTTSHAVVLHLGRPSAPDKHATTLFYGELSEAPAGRSAQGTCSADGGATLTISLLSSAKEGVRKVECEVMLPPRVPYPPKTGVSVTSGSPIAHTSRGGLSQTTCTSPRRRSHSGATRTGAVEGSGRKGSRWHSRESGSAMATGAEQQQQQQRSRPPAAPPPSLGHANVTPVLPALFRHPTHANDPAGGGQRVVHTSRMPNRPHLHTTRTWTIVARGKREERENDADMESITPAFWYGTDLG